jgi:glycosyltransferase involved in cell wall biosynthesis
MYFCAAYSPEVDIQSKKYFQGKGSMSFSVVIPLYNKALHIERALRSVFDQTVQDFEIIVINDGSSDHGPGIVEKLRDERIRLIDQPNQGASSARNRGIEAAQHNFVAFLDADDEWLPDYLYNIRILIKNFPGCGVYATGYQTIRPNGQKYLTNLSKLPLEPWTGILPNFFEVFQDGSPFCSSSTVVPKPILVDLGGFPGGVVLLEDISCWTNIAIRYPVAFNPKRLIIYHQEASNRSNRYKNLTEAPFVKTIHEAIDRSLIPVETQKEALEFIAQKQIFTALANVMEGNPLYARQLLATCSQTRKYKKLWLWWRFWASFPPGWPGKLLALKQNILTVKS